MTKFRHQSFFRNASIALGIALPALFLAISLPISGVSYRLGNVCIPNRFSALATWFAWVMLFAAVSWVIQVVTIAYCLWRFASSIVTGPATVAGAGGGVKTHQSKSSVSTAVTAESAHTRGGTSITPARQRRVAWRKVKRVLVLQWRSMVLAFLIVNLSVFFGMAFIEQNLTTKALPGTENLSSADLTWFVCLMAHDGDKNACLSQASGLGLVERRAVATFVLGSVSPTFMYPPDPQLHRAVSTNISFSHLVPRHRRPPAHDPLVHVCGVVGTTPQPEDVLPAPEHGQRGLCHVEPVHAREPADAGDRRGDAEAVVGAGGQG